MSLNLNIEKLVRPGRRPSEVEFSVVREVIPADLELLEVSAGIEAPPIKRITDRHHALARLLASGVQDSEAALILNYAPNRVSILKNSPAFQELMTLYRGEVDREFAVVLDHMSGLSRDALFELRERLEERPEKFTNGELLKIVTDMTDRVPPRPDADKLPTRIELVAPESDDSAD